MIRSRAGALPQLLTLSVCRPLHRPVEAIGVSFAWSPATEPTSRSPSATALPPPSTSDHTRTPNGSDPPGAPGPDGGENTMTAVASCCGYTESVAGFTCTQGIGIVDTTSSE